MRVAIVHDDLTRQGGAEQVVLTLLKSFPHASVYTLCYLPDKTYPEFKKYKIKTSFYRYIARNETIMKWLFFPIGLICMKMLKVHGYDVVIISNTYCGKYVNVDKKAKVFIYTYTPFRLAWDPESYKEYNQSKGMLRRLFRIVVSTLRKIDKKEVSKGHFFLGMTEETAGRIKKAYEVKEVKIIPPSINCGNFYVEKNPTQEYYLVVSRIESYKKVDLVVESFNKFGKKLIVVGNGSKREEIMAMAKSNIEFRRGVSKEDLAKLYANCKAFIFPQYEDYGLTPLEANASGRPVIAYGKGGVLTTMTPYDEGDSNVSDASVCVSTNRNESTTRMGGEDSNGKNFTAVFFQEQTQESLIAAIKKLESLEINPTFIRHHAEKFDEPAFIKRIQGFVERHWKK